MTRILIIFDFRNGIIHIDIFQGAPVQEGVCTQAQPTSDRMRAPAAVASCFLVRGAVSSSATANLQEPGNQNEHQP